VPWKQLHCRGLNRRNHDGRAAGRHFPQRRCALLLYFRVRREIFERQNIVRGKLEHAVGRDRSRQIAPGAKRDLQRVGRFIVGHDYNHGGVGGSGKERNIEGSRRRGQSRHTPPPTGEGEVPSCLFKCG
jgi:hypothetical protein